MMKGKQLQKIIQKLVEKSFKDGKIVESQITKAIKALKSLPRYQAIQALSEYIKLLKTEERKHTLYIESTIQVSTNQIKRIKKNIERRVKITKVITNINPEILGGFKLKVGDEVWDESILSKINQVKEAIAHGRPY